MSISVTIAPVLGGNVIKSVDFVTIVAICQVIVTI